VPAEVKVELTDSTVRVVGPKGVLSRPLNAGISIEQEDGRLLVKRSSDARDQRSLHGLTRALVANMVTGVTTGFSKTLDITGVGYRAQKQGDKIAFQLGYSHPVEYVPPAGIQITNVETFTPTAANEWLSSRLVVQGIDKELVGAVAAKLKELRPVEPYKAKGIRYRGEVVRRKVGKAAGKGKGAK
jgi:large subunit ribosomal protein L6